MYLYPESKDLPLFSLAVCNTAKFCITLYHVITGLVSLIPILVPSPIHFTSKSSLCTFMGERANIFCSLEWNNSRLHSTFSLAWAVMASVLYRTCLSRPRWVMWQHNNRAVEWRRSKVCGARCERSGVCVDMSTLWGKLGTTEQWCGPETQWHLASVDLMPTTLELILLIFGSIRLALFFSAIWSRVSQYLNIVVAYFGKLHNDF